MNIHNKDVLIGNIYIAPGNENQLKILGKRLERHRGKNILLGDLNCRSNTWDKNIQQQNRIGWLLEDIINKYTQTLHHPRITIHLTFVRGVKNVQVKAKEFEPIKSEHLAIEVLLEDTQTNLKQPKFKTKNANWENWQKHLTPHLSNYLDNFQDI